jgi:cation diffusion facilitator CzcD-associated flavoprotein CzcO
MTSELYDAVIVGAGFGGIGAAIQLNRMGYHNFVILDREDDLGGTWHVNRYPAGRRRTDHDVLLLRAEPQLVRLFHRHGDQAVCR